MTRDTLTDGGRGQNPTASEPAASPTDRPTVTIHIVCRECPHEALVDAHTRDAAVERAREAQLDHAIEAGHTRTVPGVVADQTEVATDAV